jgi:predicted O-methyltransferase YrrM
MPAIIPTFEALVESYRNTAEHNDAVYRQLDTATWSDPDLAAHRRYVEEHKLGFGDPAFHALWLRLLTAASRKFGAVRALEIGVYKGQSISLWALIARLHGLDLAISAVSPLRGQPLPRSPVLKWLRYRLDHRFRERIDNGNFYAEEDYETIIRSLFAHFGLDFARVVLHRGFSTDPAVLSELAAESFHVVYVDGDHTYRGALHDFSVFGPKVVPGGWLVVDDAGCDLPGTAFWKGHPAVSRAVKELPSMGFTNILNVGHIRIFEHRP